MQWEDKGIILSMRRHGESSHLLSILTENHGRRVSMLRAKPQPGLQIGSIVHCTWKGRSHDQLGYWSIEPVDLSCTLLLSQSERLNGLQYICHILDTLLPDSHPYPALFNESSQIIKDLRQPVWLAKIIHFELRLLEEIGFGLDLSKCAQTGTEQDLTHVSPNSGRAVSKEAAAPYIKKLLILPDFIKDKEKLDASYEDLLHGMRLTGHFLDKFALAQSNKPIPPSRHRITSILHSLVLKESA